MNDSTAPLPLARLAEASAHLRQYAAPFHPKVLERLGLSEAEVAAATTHWSRAMFKAFEDGDPTLLLEFAKVYGRVETRVRLHRWPVGELRPDVALARTHAERKLPRRAMKPLQRQPTAPGLPPAEPLAPVNQLPTYLRDEVRPVPVGEPPPAMPSGDETAMVDPIAAAKGQNLPFAPDSPLARLARLREEAAKERADAAAPRPGTALDRGTVALPDGLESTPSLPFKEVDVPPDAVDLSIFPIERYAEVTVALAKSDDRASVLRRFVLTEGMWRAVAQAWAARINDDPALRADFHAAVERVRQSADRSSR